MAVSTKKVLIAIGGSILALGLLVAIFVAGLVGIAYYSVGKSEAAQTAKTFLKQNAILIKDIGAVKDFGSFVSGKIDAGDSGAATLGIKVIGMKKTVNATVELEYRTGRSWRVTKASYVNDQGKIIDLLNEFGPADMTGTS